MLTIKTYLDKSSISGTGCFADQFIPKGTVVWELQDNFDVVLTQEEVDVLPNMAKEFVHHFGYYNEQEGWVLCMDNAKYFNHSPYPNVDDTTSKTLANRDILKGEEIICNYFTFDEKSNSKLLMGCGDDPSSLGEGRTGSTGATGAPPVPKVTDVFGKGWMGKRRKK